MRRKRSLKEDIPLPLFPDFFIAPYAPGVFPQYSADAELLIDMLRTAVPGDILGLDLEYGPRGLTIAGLANERLACGAAWSDRIGQEIRKAAEDGVVFSAYAGIAADRPALRACGFDIPLESVSDAMIRFWLVYAHLCKTPGVRYTEEQDPEEGSYGFLGLWTAASLLTDLPVWKTCRGPACSGPCPKHQPMAYCAVDAWAGLMVDLAARKLAALHGISEDMYVLNARVADLMQILQDRGIAVDLQAVRRLAGEMEARKGLLEGALGVNPKSPKQVMAKLRKLGHILGSTSRGDIDDLLRGILEDSEGDQKTVYELIHNWTDPEDFRVLNDEAVRFIAMLLAYKVAGKGLKPWYGPVMDRESDRALLHPRVSVVGTSTGRTSCSSPNLQNVATRGWGKKVKTPIVPRVDGDVLYEADYSQLELRMMLYLAGRDVRNVGADAFAWLVSQAPGEFEAAAQRIGSGVTARDVAKITSHASNYGEGLVLISNLRRHETEIAAGALEVHEDWRLGHYLVGFTGINLARRLFGDGSSLKARRAALEIQRIYFSAFPEIREFQKKATMDAVSSGFVRTRTSRVLRLPNRLDRAAKIALAMHGQGTSADFVKETITRIAGTYPVLADRFYPPVHDSIVLCLPRGRVRELAAGVASVMFSESLLLPGFLCPGKVKLGYSYGTLLDGEEFFRTYPDCDRLEEK